MGGGGYWRMGGGEGGGVIIRPLDYSHSSPEVRRGYLPKIRRQQALVRSHYFQILTTAILRTLFVEVFGNRYCLAVPLMET
jgi:hypothetical protein